MMPVVSLRLLGPFGLTLDGTPLATHTWQRRPASLLRMLAVSADFQRQREEVMDLLWPDSDVHAGASNLRYVLHLLRRYLAPNPPPVVTRPGWITLNPLYSWEVDLVRFEQAALIAQSRQQDLSGAASLYRGEPLADDRYDDWAMPVRERVQRVWSGLCRRLAADARQRGAVDEAARWYEQLLQHDPLDEEAMQGLLQVLGDLGRTAEALQRYSVFARRYADEMDAEPGDDLMSVAQQLSVEVRSPAPSKEQLLPPFMPTYPLPSGDTFVGRAAELEQIVSALPGSTVDNAPRLIILTGEAGMGKTWLEGAAARAARDQGLLVLAGGCYEQEGHLPYGPFHDALMDYIRAVPVTLLQSQLDGIAASVALVVPELHRYLPGLVEDPAIDPEARKLRLFSAIAQLLERITALQPLMLVVDDVHWADDETLHLMHYVVRQPGLGRMLILAGCRSEEVPRLGVLAQLLESEQKAGSAIRTLQLRPLSDEELARLLSDRLADRCAPSLLETVRNRSAANPFFALQIVRLLQQEGKLHATSQGWTVEAVDGVELPGAVRDVISRRLRRLQPDQRAVLAAGSVLGREFAYSALEAIHSGDEESLWSALDHALDAFILAEANDGYVFRHPLLREVVYASIPAHRRAVLHARAGTALERIYGRDVTSRSAELAYHFRLAGSSFLHQAVHYAVAAGDQAERGFAHAQAEDQYRQALSLIRHSGIEPSENHPGDSASTQTSSVEAGIWIKLGSLLTIEGRHTEALDALEEAVRLLDMAANLEAVGRVTAQIALVHSRRGSPRDGEARVRACLSAWPTDTPSPALAELYLALSQVAYWDETNRVGDLEPARRARAIAVALNDPFLSARAEEQYGLTLLSNRQTEEGLQVLQAALPRLEAVGAHSSVMYVLQALSQISWWSGNIEQDRKFLMQGLETARRVGDPVLTASFLTSLGRSAFYSGDWDLAVRYGEEGVAAIERVQGARSEGYARGMAPTVFMLRGVEGAVADVERWSALCEQLGDFISPGYVLSWAATLEIACGRTADAIERLESLGPRLRGHPLAKVLVTLAYAYLQANDVQRASACIDRAEPLIGGNRLVMLEMLRAQALLAAHRQSVSEGVRLLGSAVEQARAIPTLFGEARFLHDLGILQLRAGNAVAGRGTLQAAIAIFQKLGATPFVTWVERALHDSFAET